MNTTLTEAKTEADAIKQTVLDLLTAFHLKYPDICFGIDGGLIHTTIEDIAPVTHERKTRLISKKTFVTSKFTIFMEEENSKQESDNLLNVG